MVMTEAAKIDDLFQKRLKVIYVAGQYRADSENGVFENIVKARTAALKLWNQGWAVICPHTNTMFMGSRLGGDEKFIEGDLEILARCDAIYMLKGWEDSHGANMEKTLAQELGKEIIYE